MQNILYSIEDIFNENAPCVFVEVIHATSGTPCKAGFKMIVNENGRVEGSVGGGVLEKVATEIAQKMIKDNEKTSIYTFELKNDIPISQEKNNISIIDKKDIDIDKKEIDKKEIDKKNESKKELEKEPINLYAACGGIVTLFFEFHDILTLSIFGCGHIGQNLVEITNGLGYKIQLFDVRKESLDQFSSNFNSNYIKTFHLKPVEKEGETLFFVDEIPLSNLLKNDSFVVITTHGHTYDFSIAKYILNLDKKFKYIGMIGSKNKVKGFIDELKEKSNKLHEKLLSSNFYSPIGLDIGGTNAREIALSITAQIQSVRYGKNNNNLSIVK
ncbi:MAG: XdhC/CoxI family protein [Spirochaetota bacterium]